VVHLVVLACVLMATTKKVNFFREKVHPRENPGYAYAQQHSTLQPATAQFANWHVGAYVVTWQTRTLVPSLSTQLMSAAAVLAPMTQNNATNQRQWRRLASDRSTSRLSILNTD